MDEQPDARARILSEATRLFAELGYAATSVREVVEAAGVTKPAMYYWFRNKEELFREALSVQLGHLSKICDDACSGEGSPEGRLCDFVHAYLAQAETNPDGLMLLLRMSTASDAGSARVEVLQASRFAVQRVGLVVKEAVNAGEIRADLDPQFVASAVMGAVNHFVVGRALGWPTEPDPAERIIELFRSGWRAQ